MLVRVLKIANTRSLGIENLQCDFLKSYKPTAFIVKLINMSGKKIKD